jgi:hypothetical protein
MMPGEDNDSDGLDNYAEYWHMTNPFSADSDSDGWPDALEVASFETDPLRSEPEIQMLFVDPASPCRHDCGTQEQPFGNLQTALDSRKPAVKTLVLVAAGMLNESVKIETQLPHGSFLGLFGGFESRGWTRGNGRTVLQAIGDQHVLKLSSPTSKSCRVVVEGFTIIGGVLIDGSDKLPIRVKLSGNQIINSPNWAGVEIRGNLEGQVQLMNNYVAGNKAGILDNSPTWLLVLNCTIADNAGPGMQVTAEAARKEACWSTSINNILWNNRADLVGVKNVVATLCRDDPRCIPRDPGLHRDSPELPTGSPARDAGVYPLPELELFFDLERHPRVVGAGIDLGAVEIQKGKE